MSAKARNLSISVLLVGFYLTLATCYSYADTTLSHNRLSEGKDRGDYDDFDKRGERYAFGLGRRAYTYTNGPGVKRLPVYNFGLGKRSLPYAFGLGKRVSAMDYLDPETYLYEQLQQDNPSIEIPDKYDDNSEKRARPYSFGLGKRSNIGDNNLMERAVRQRYNFGLGKRSSDSDDTAEDMNGYDYGFEKRASNDNFERSERQRYGFGLGKRDATLERSERQRYGFGLGKRATDPNNMERSERQRYGFGLGKRSADFNGDRLTTGATTKYNNVDTGH